MTGLAFGRSAGERFGHVLINEGADVFGHAYLSTGSILPLLFRQVHGNAHFILKWWPTSFVGHDYMIAIIDALSILCYHLFCLGMVASPNVTPKNSIPPATATPQPAASLDKSNLVGAFCFQWRTDE